MIIKPWDPPAERVFFHKKKGRVPADLISICVTNYNYAHFIEECLNSLADQTHQALDLIIVDDASTDPETDAILLPWLEEHKDRFYRVSFLVNPYNQGPSFSRNIAFNYALGEWVFIMDADNTVYPTALAKHYDALNRGQFPAVYCQLEEFGDRNGIGQADIWDTARMRKANYIDVMALVRKDVWQQLGGFSHIEDGWEDYDFWMKFIDNGLEPGYLPEILCRYRVHNASRTAREALIAHERLELIMAFRHPATEA